MDTIETLEELEAQYGPVKETALAKVADHLMPLHRKWIMQSRFCILTTVGPEGTDSSPRGDDGSVVAEIDPKTLAMPDWRGNNRLDSLRNIVRDGRVSLMFLVPGANNVIRVNGRAKLTNDRQMLARFEVDGKQPRTVIVISITEVYSQRSRALMRSGLWTAGDESAGLPSVGDLLSEATDGAIDATSYDQQWRDLTRT